MASSSFSLKTFRTMLMATTIGIVTFVVSHHVTFNSRETFISTALADNTLGQEVGGHLQRAQSALTGHLPKQAMIEVNAADTVKNKTDYERYVIAQMRASVAAQLGDAAVTIQAYNVLLNNPRTPKDSRRQIMMAQASIAYSAHDYTSAARAASRYLHEIGPDQSMQTLLAQCYYIQKNWTGTANVLEKVMATAKQSHATPPESLLQMLATAYGHLNNVNEQTSTYVHLVKAYPRPQYWQILIHDLVTDQSLSPRLVFNLQRLRLATGVLKNPSDFQDMAERAVQIGLPQLALNLLNEGYNRHILGTGPNAQAQERFRSFVKQQAEKTRNDLPTAVQAAEHSSAAGPALTAGYNLVLNGQTDRGMALIKDGLSKKPRFPQVAQLEAGMALMDGGHYHDAIALLNNMNGDGSVFNLAQLWSVYLRNAHLHN